MLSEPGTCIVPNQGAQHTHSSIQSSTADKFFESILFEHARVAMQQSHSGIASCPHLQARLSTKHGHIKLHTK